MQTTLFSLPNLPVLNEDETPLYKATTYGMAHLSNTELIALAIQGTNDKAMTAVRMLLNAAQNNLRELGKLSVHDLTKIEGIGKSKALAIVAAIELGRRRAVEAALELPQIKCSADIAGFLKPRLQDLKQEVFCCLFLNRNNKVMHFETVSVGGITGTVADPRIILRKALEVSAVSLIISHNHPSGSLQPSRADEELTKKIKEAASYMDIKVLDHVIVSEHGYYSFADEGIL